MPELPEVETTARELKPLIKGKVFHDLWVEHLPMLRRPKTKQAFLKMIRGEKILDVSRRGKMVWFALPNGKHLFVHQKLSGHLVYGRWQRKGKTWLPTDARTEKLWQDSKNRFLRLAFLFSDGSALALSDVRKFGRAYALKTEEIKTAPELKIGVDPLTQKFNLAALKPFFAKRRIPVKQALLDQTIIAGIGNIYGDEILWAARIAPLKPVKALDGHEYRRLGRAIPAVLRKAVKAGGTSIDNYRWPDGKKGGYQDIRAVYQRTGKPCRRCGTAIKRVVIAGRSSHFCPRCQK